MRYSYETLPGVTILRTDPRDGYTRRELDEELRSSGDGKLCGDEESGRIDDFIRAVEGRRATEGVPVRIRK